MGISRFISFTPYFILGWNLRQYNIEKKIINLPGLYKIGIIIAGIAGCFIATKIPIGVLWGHEALDIPVANATIYKFMAFGIAIINSLAFCVLIPRGINMADGRHTLSYYLLHTIILYPILAFISKFIASDLFSAICILIVVLYSLHVLSHVRIINCIFSMSPLTIYDKMRNKVLQNKSIRRLITRN